MDKHRSKGGRGGVSGNMEKGGEGGRGGSSILASLGGGKHVGMYRMRVVETEKNETKPKTKGKGKE